MPDPGVEPRRESAQLYSPADEGVALGGEVVADLSERAPKLACTYDAVCLVDIRRGNEGRGATHAQLEDFERRLDPFETVVAVALDLRTFGKRVRKRLPGGAAEERLSRAGEGHDPGSEGRG